MAVPASGAEKKMTDLMTIPKRFFKGLGHPVPCCERCGGRCDEIQSTSRR